MRFLNNPEAVAKESNVKLKPEQIEKVKKTAAFIDTLNDIRLPPGPIFYPVDRVLNQWKFMELTNVIKYNYITRRRWIFYPMDVNMGRLKEVSERQF